jgi:hypothetical protein
MFLETAISTRQPSAGLGARCRELTWPEQRNNHPDHQAAAPDEASREPRHGRRACCSAAEGTVTRRERSKARACGGRTTSDRITSTSWTLSRNTDVSIVLADADGGRSPIGAESRSHQSLRLGGEVSPACNSVQWSLATMANSASAATCNV